MQKIWNEMRDITFILLVTAAFAWVANVVAYTPDLMKSSIGCLVAKIPGLNKLPVVFWVSMVAVVISLPGFPGGATVLSYTKEVNFLAITTPLLAYAGLSLGKDLEAFKRLSWRIVPVALAVAAGSFLCATAMAELMLHLEGVF